MVFILILIYTLPEKKKTKQTKKIEIRKVSETELVCFPLVNCKMQTSPEHYKLTTLPKSPPANTHSMHEQMSTVTKYQHFPKAHRKMTLQETLLLGNISNILLVIEIKTN